MSLLDDSVVDRRHWLGHRQLTDTYLLALAVQHGAPFVTVDRAVWLASVRGATEEFLVTI